jgi:hypothetical protein
LDSSPRKRTPCTIGCKSLDDLELISRRGSLRSQFAVTCEDFTGGKSSKTNVDDGVNTHDTLLKVKETLDKKKQRKWLPLKTNRAYLLRPVCSETRRGKLCTKGLNHSCTTETMQTILDSTSFNTGEANFISIDVKVSDKNKDISLIRGKFSSATNLPTYIKSGVQLETSLVTQRMCSRERQFEETLCPMRNMNQIYIMTVMIVAKSQTYLRMTWKEEVQSLLHLL